MNDLKSLVQRAKSGAPEAYTELVRKFCSMAFGYAYSVLGDFQRAEDAAQEAFLEAYRNLAQLREPAAFPAWFRKIVRKQCDRFARRKYIDTTAVDFPWPLSTPEPGPGDLAERREIVEVVHQAIRALPESERTVTTLYYINGYSQKEIADFLEIPVTTVDGRLRMSRKRLKERMVAMVANTFKSSAPKSDEASDRIAFLLKLGDRLARGEPILCILDSLAEEAATEKLRHTIQKLRENVGLGGALFDALDRYGSGLPPMVISLIHDGEEFCILEETVRLAGQWLRDGKFKVNPYLYMEGSLYGLMEEIRKAVEGGASELIIDSTSLEPIKAIRECKVSYPRLVMSDGAVKKGRPIGERKLFLLLNQLRVHTILDQAQKGDAITGKLRTRLSPGDPRDTYFPISYRPLPEGEEVRIRLGR